MQLEVVVDRIEGDVAVLEVDGRTIDWPRDLLPPGVCEGAALTIAITARAGDLDAAQARLERLRARSGDDDGEIDL